MKIDLTGQKFNRLTALRPTDKRRQRSIVWEFKCDCGNIFESTVNLVTKNITKSCGCLRREKTSITGKVTGKINGKLMITHGQSKIMDGHPSPTYQSWVSMNKRCNNPNYREYKYYGGRGIKVCIQWLNFENFLKDMGERPLGKTLDRYPDKNGDYKPGNCRWATPSEQCLNRRKWNCHDNT
jgi:hypothetical protein